MKKLALLSLLILTANLVRAELPQSGQIIPLWNEKAPLAKGNADTDKPTIQVFLADPAKANGSSVIICPGGGYIQLMMTYEGRDIAKWLNDQGIAGIVLKYRVGPYQHPAPMLDGQRAVRYVRSHAKEWNLDPNKIGMAGFSAGGHVAATIGTHYDDGNLNAADAIDKAGCRPNFLVLVYAVISMGEKGNAGCRATLLGQNPTQADIDLMSCEKQVSAKTPPAFLVHSKTDKAVDVANSAMFYDALKKNNVAAEFMELPTGEHGLGCGVGELWKSWQDKCSEWLKTQGFRK